MAALMPSRIETLGHCPMTSYMTKINKNATNTRYSYKMYKMVQGAATTMTS